MRLLCLLVMTLLTACQALPPLPDWQSPEGREHADLGEIIELSSGEHISPQDLVARLANADRVLVGERHDNPDHHALQLWLLQALAQQRPQGSVLLEMINPDQQSKVTEVQLAFARGERPDDLPASLAWQEGWPWELYGPLVEYSLAQPAPLLQANLDRNEIADIYRRQPRPSGLAAERHVTEALARQIRESHCGMLPESQLPAMLAVQQQRDRRMADRLEAAPKPAILLAGGFHVRRDLGVPLHLQGSRDKPAVLVLMLAEVGVRIGDDRADYVWFTPAQPEEDFCARFRQPSR